MVAQPIPSNPPSQTSERRSAVPERRHLVHGVRGCSDDYAWLKADNWQDVLREPGRCSTRRSAPISKTENAYSRGLIGRVSGLQDRNWSRRCGAASRKTTPACPRRTAVRLLRSPSHRGAASAFCRSARAGGDPVVLLDGDALAAGKPFYHRGGRRHSDDHRLLAWSCDEAGSEFYAIRVRDMTSLDRPRRPHHGHDRPRRVGQAGPQFPLCRRRREPPPPAGQAPRRGHADEADTLVYEEKVDGWFVNIDRSQSGDFAFIGISDHETSEAYVLSLRRLHRPAPPDRAARHRRALRRRSRPRSFRHPDQRRWRGGLQDRHRPGRRARPENWRDLVPHRPG